MSINACAFTISNTPGTSGAFTVSAADTGAVRAPGAAHDGAVCRLFIREGTAFEIRSGSVYTHSGTSMSRGTLEDSSTGSAISFTSAAIVNVIGWDAGTADRTMLAAPGIWSANFKAYGDIGLAVASGTLALTANRAYALPAQRAFYGAIDAILFRVTTAGAGGTQAVAAIFEHGTDGLPGAQLAVSSGVAVDSTGNKTATFTAFVPPERFFMCLLSDGTPTVQSYASGIVHSNAMGAGASIDARSYIHHVGATSLTFPAPWTPVGNAANAARPLLLARCV